VRSGRAKDKLDRDERGNEGRGESKGEEGGSERITRGTGGTVGLKRQAESGRNLRNVEAEERQEKIRINGRGVWKRNIRKQPGSEIRSKRIERKRKEKRETFGS